MNIARVKGFFSRIYTRHVRSSPLQSASTDSEEKVSKQAVQDSGALDSTSIPAISQMQMELETYKRAFETTANDRDLWKNKYLWLEWDVRNPLPNNYNADAVNLRDAQLTKTLKFISGSRFESLKRTSAIGEVKRDKIRLDGILIGAEKSGTSYFYSCVREHESVYVGEKDRQLTRLLAPEQNAFEDLFLAEHNGEPVVLAFDAGFMLNVDSATVLWRRTRGGLKVIAALLRDPIERAISEYRMRLRQGYEFLPFCEANRQGAERRRVFPGAWEQRWAYLERGLYWRQLEPYARLFGQECLMVRLFEESIVKKPMELLDEFFAKLGLDTPVTRAFVTMVEQGGKETPGPIQVTESQRRAGVTEAKMAEWMAYNPTGRVLENLRAYYTEDVRMISDFFGLRTDTYWENFK